MKRDKALWLELTGRSTDMLWIGCLRSETTSDDISSEVVILDGDDTLGSRKS